MTTEPANGFLRRYRWAIVPAAAVTAIALLVLVYRATMPRSDQAVPSTQASESEVLRVGALPVT